jgi:D-alanyl-D-alanine carboxypeptidase
MYASIWNRLGFAFSSLLVVALPFSILSAATPEQQSVSSLIKPLVDRHLFSGSIIVVRNGHVVAEQHSGYANREHSVPITAETRFYVASVTKSFTAAGILLLRDAGALSLDDPISKFIHDFPKGGITIRQLLTHTSGFQHPVFYADYNDLGKRSYTTAEAVDVFKDRPLISTPGTKHLYSNYNYVVLARIIEVVSGETYSEFVAERMFRPQRLSTAGNHTSWARIVPNRAAGYQPVGMEDFENDRFFDYSIDTGAASLYMSGKDLSRWVIALGAGLVLGSTSTNDLLGDSKHGGFLHGRDIAGHQAVALNGWDGIGFAADALYFPEAHLAVAVAVNENDSGIAPYLTGAIAQSILTGKQAKPLQFSKPVANAQRYAGKYRFGPDFYSPGQELEIVAKGNQLFEHQKNPERVIGLIPMADGSFMYRSHWARVAFQEENGRVTSLTFDDFKVVKVQ